MRQEENVGGDGTGVKQIIQYYNSNACALVVQSVLTYEYV
jgi:hypothetical protein